MKAPNLNPSQKNIPGTNKTPMFMENMDSAADDSPRMKYVSQSAAPEDQEVPEYTGRYFVILAEGEKDFKKVHKVLQDKAGIKVASSDDFKDATFTQDRIRDADAYIYQNLGIALVGAEDDQVQSIRENNDDSYVVVPELITRVPIMRETGTAVSWGIEATNVHRSLYTGKNVRIAILDTGFDLNHPDFAGRALATASFTGEIFGDNHGHGTHCTGIACGSVNSNGMRYGVASGAHIHVGKVLDNTGRGAQSWILDGMQWAVEQGCRVISMSLGSPVLPGMVFNIAYERQARYARANGCIVIAAAGNESRRAMGVINPVGSPGDCPSVISVAAIDKDFQIANFSNRGIGQAGKVNVSGPGVDVYSSWPMPKMYNTISGTSMATPYVAGIMGLLWEQYPGYTVDQIIAEFTRLVLPLATLNPADAGAGLATAPYAMIPAV